MLRPIATYERKIIDFMTSRNKHYATRINALECTWDEVNAEAGPNGWFCQFTQAKLREIEDEREDEIQAAVDRYEDWASD